MSIFSLTKLIIRLKLSHCESAVGGRSNRVSKEIASLATLVRNDTYGEYMLNSGLMTIEDLADYLKVTRRTIYDWVKHRKIPALKLVGQWRFKKDKIDAWIENKSQPH